VLKLAEFVRFPAGADRSERVDAWEAEYVPAVSRATGATRSESNRLARLRSSPHDRPFDGYACWWWADGDADSDALVAAGEVAGPAGASETRVVVDDHVIDDGGRGAFKLVSLVRFRPDLAPDWIRGSWAGEHAELTLAAGGFTRYVQNHVVDSVGEPGPLQFDGFAEHWFESEADLDRVEPTPAWQALVADGYRMFDMGDVTVADLISNSSTQG
jgi:hypothetical protein